jgi:hypothetical protein
VVSFTLAVFVCSFNSYWIVTLCYCHHWENRQPNQLSPWADVDEGGDCELVIRAFQTDPVPDT